MNGLCMISCDVDGGGYGHAWPANRVRSRKARRCIICEHVIPPGEHMLYQRWVTEDGWGSCRVCEFCDDFFNGDWSCIVSHVYEGYDNGDGVLQEEWENRGAEFIVLPKSRRLLISYHFPYAAKAAKRDAHRRWRKGEKLVYGPDDTGFADRWVSGKGGRDE